MRWKNLFRSHILDRGYEYYHSGAVKNLLRNGNLISADVVGSEEYEVTIEIENREISYMYCSCPYANDNNNCKHMAAVLFELENPSNSTKESNVDLDKLVSNLSKKEMKGLLIEIFNQDENLRNRFLLSITKDFNFNYYKNLIESIIDKYTSYDGYINYYKADDFFYEIDGIFHNDIQKLIKNNQYKNAFDLSLYIFERVCNEDIDDSDGGLTMLAQKVRETIEEILNYTFEQDYYFERLYNEIKKNKTDFFGDCIEEFLFSLFDDKFLKEKIELCEEKIEYYCNCADDFSKYNLEYWLELRISLFEKEKSETEQIDIFCSKYWKYYPVRRFYIDKRKENENYKDAIKALKESLLFDSNLFGLVCSYKEELKNLYKLTGDFESYQNILEEIVLSEGGDNLPAFCELKKLYTIDEWTTVRDQILEKVSTRGIDILYNHEKMYSKLHACVLNCRGLGLFYKYKEQLLPLFPKQLLNKYITELNNYAAIANSRNQYKDLAQMLLQLKDLPDGEDEMINILSEWRDKYKRRTAMMDELNKKFRSLF